MSFNSSIPPASHLTFSRFWIVPALAAGDLDPRSNLDRHLLAEDESVRSDASFTYGLNLHLLAGGLSDPSFGDSGDFRDLAV